jgi:hypothetical protein
MYYLLLLAPRILRALASAGKGLLGWLKKAFEEFRHGLNDGPP